MPGTGCWLYTQKRGAVLSAVPSPLHLLVVLPSIHQMLFCNECRLQLLYTHCGKSHTAILIDVLCHLSAIKALLSWPAHGHSTAPGTDTSRYVVQVRRRTTKQACPLTLTLYVRWFSPQGRTKVNKLLLRPVTSVEALQVHTLRKLRQNSDL